MWPNLGLTPKFTRGRGVNLEKCFKNVKIIGFFNMFLHIFFVNEHCQNKAELSSKEDRKY